jgi:hypothetical protein
MTEKELFNSIYPKQESSGIIYEKDLQKSFSILMGKVYLDFVNLFIYILRILGSKK